MEYGKWESSERQLTLSHGNRGVLGSRTATGVYMQQGGSTDVPRVVSSRVVHPGLILVHPGLILVILAHPGSPRLS